MPTYDFVCPSEHNPYEVRCSIAQKDAELHRCPECGEPGRQIILTAPAMPTTIVIDTPGSKKFKAGYVHSHGDKPVKKVSSGYGGVLNPSTRPVHPIAAWTMPEAVRSKGSDRR